MTIEPHECRAVRERQQLAEDIRRAIDPQLHLPGARLDGTTPNDLNYYFDILKGIVAEYQDGGDQMTEDCTCGCHT